MEVVEEKRKIADERGAKGAKSSSKTKGKRREETARRASVASNVKEKAVTTSRRRRRKSMAETEMDVFSCVRGVAEFRANSTSAVFQSEFARGRYSSRDKCIVQYMVVSARKTQI